MANGRDSKRLGRSLFFLLYFAVLFSPYTISFVVSIIRKYFIFLFPMWTHNIERGRATTGPNPVAVDSEWIIILFPSFFYRKMTTPHVSRGCLMSYGKIRRLLTFFSYFFTRLVSSDRCLVVKYMAEEDEKRKGEDERRDDDHKLWNIRLNSSEYIILVVCTSQRSGR